MTSQARSSDLPEDLLDDVDREVLEEDFRRFEKDVADEKAIKAYGFEPLAQITHTDPIRGCEYVVGYAVTKEFAEWMKWWEPTDGRTEFLDRCPFGGVARVCPDRSPPLLRGAFDYIRYGYGWYDRLEGRDLEMYNLVLSQTFPVHRKDWVLLNLDKMEGVRASALAELCGKPDDIQPFLPNCRADLGHALLARICWANGMDSAWMGQVHFSPEVGRGKWAGDRFAITTLDKVAKPRKGQKQWKDVSKTVVRDVKRKIGRAHV